MITCVRWLFSLALPLVVAYVAAQPGAKVDLGDSEVPQGYMQAYAQLLWPYLGSGQVAADTSTFDAFQALGLGDNHDPFYTADSVFMEVFANELQLNPDMPGYYTLDDLLEELI